MTPRYIQIWQSKEMSHDFVCGQSGAGLWLDRLIKRIANDYVVLSTWRVNDYTIYSQIQNNWADQWRIQKLTDGGGGRQILQEFIHTTSGT